VSAGRVVGALSLVGLLAACGAAEPGFVDLATLERPSSPNTYLVCPADRTAAEVDREPPVYDVTVDTLETRWLAFLADEPRLTRRATDEPARRYLFVQRTPVFRFPDVIQVEFVEVPPAQSTLCVYSRSVYGYSDMGKNRDRVEGWFARVTP